jgi:hypothetical protein
MKLIQDKKNLADATDIFTNLGVIDEYKVGVSIVNF